MIMDICTLVSLVIRVNKILNYLLKQVKENFESNNNELKIKNPEKYYQKLESRIFFTFVFIASVLTLVGVFITFFIMEYIL